MVRKAGYDSQWERLRAAHLRRFPLCAVAHCGRRAKHVDHIMAVSAAPWRLLDRSNLQSLCQRHHNQLTAAYDLGDLGAACDESGMPVSPSHPWNMADNGAAIRSVNARPSRSAPSRLAARLKRKVTRR